MSTDLNKLFSDAIDIDRYIHSNKLTETFAAGAKIYCKLAVNPSANGSAYIEYNSIKVYCSVNGPSEMRQDGQLVTSLKFSPFVSTCFSTEQRSETEKRLSRLLLSALEPSVMLHSFPRGMYEVAALVLDYSGNQLDVDQCLAAVVTCAGMALVTAGTQMYDLPVAVKTDLSSFKNTSGSMCIAALPTLQQISMMHTSGARIPDPEILPDILKSCLNLCSEVRLTLKHFLSEYFQSMK